MELLKNKKKADTIYALTATTPGASGATTVLKREWYRKHIHVQI
jgi:hypothetical protein